jgi:UDP-N-acetylglucosamine 2-epimerase
MKKAALIIGARPQFIKIAPLVRDLGRFFRIVLVHTGQHYDFSMSDTFFNELDLPAPDYHLDIVPSGRSRQTGRMIEGLQSVLAYEKPLYSIVVGDTDSTLAAALASVRLGIPIVHVEAGVRSKDKNLPEQINRVVTDSVADCFLCPTPISAENLKKEGKSRNIFDTGDVIYDCLRLFEDRIPDSPSINIELPEKYVLVTLHRAEAVDSNESLSAILNSLGTSPHDVVFPVHPRTRKMMDRFGLDGSLPGNVMMTEPLGYLDLLSLLKSCEYVVSDSGGVQREAAFLGKRTVVPRPETEWRELEDSGWVRVAKYEFDLQTAFDGPVKRNLENIMRPASIEMTRILRDLY